MFYTAPPARPVHPQIAAQARRRLIVGPNLAPDGEIRLGLWIDLLADRAARLAATAAAQPQDAA